MMRRGARRRLILVALTLIACVAGCDASRETGPFGRHGAGLVTRDLVVGSGAIAKIGDTLTVNYRLLLGGDPAREVDSSYERGQPFVFQLGTGQVIRGWDLGIPGMRVGGQRELVVPPVLGYGAKGVPGVIPPNATLYFSVELIDVK